MLNKEDILARLQNGESVVSIADEIADVLNAANSEFQKEKAAENEAQLKEAQKLQDLQDIIDLMHDFCIEYYCDNDEDINTVNAAFATLDAKSVNQMIEEAGAYAVKMVEMQKQLDSAFGNLFGTPVVKKAPKKGAPTPKTKSADDIIGNFLSSMGLK